MNQKAPRVVAELGRPETAQETADRKSAATRKHRENQTLRNLVLATLASLGIVLFLVLVVVRPDQSTPLKPIDYGRTASQAQGASADHLVVPRLSDSWKANRATYDGKPADGIPTWSIGFITPKTQFIQVTQGVGGNDSWVLDQLQKKRATGSMSIDGVDWTVYDHRDDDDPGNLAYSLAATIGDSDYVLSGTATTPEFRTLARAVKEDAR